MSSQSTQSIINSPPLINLTRENIIKNAFILIHTATPLTSRNDSVAIAVLDEIEAITTPNKFELFPQEEEQQQQQQQHFGIMEIEISSTPTLTSAQSVDLQLDISGSMDDVCADGRTKMHHVKHTTKNILSVIAATPESNITISVDGFDDKIEKIIAPTKVTEDNIEQLHKTLESKLRPRSSTNIEIALKNAQANKQQQQQQQQHKTMIFMTDGQVTAGEKKPQVLKALLDTDTTTSNIFIGFGVDHDASLLRDLASAGNNSGSYFVVDKVENAGLVFGEVLHGILNAALRQVRIEIQNGEIYDYRTNTWQPALEIASLNSDAKKTYHVRTTSPDEITATITATLILPTLPTLLPTLQEQEQYQEQVDRVPELIDGTTRERVPINLTKYMLRQRVMELLFETTSLHQQLDSKIKPGQKQNMKRKLREFLKYIQAYMKTNNIDDEFHQTLCADLYVAFKSLSQYNGEMYSAARQNSQGQQLSYNVSAPEDDDNDYELRQPIRRQNAMNPCFDQSSNNHDLDEYEYSDEDNEVLRQVPKTPQLSRSNTSSRQEAVMRMVSGTPHPHPAALAPLKRSNAAPTLSDDEEEERLFVPIDPAPPLAQAALTPLAAAVAPAAAVSRN